MNIGSPGTRQARKRERQVQFDLNRSSPQIAHKFLKSNTPTPKPRPKSFSEMAEPQKDQGQIRDLSQTIITDSSRTHPNGKQPAEAAFACSSGQVGYLHKGMGVDNSVKLMIEESINSQVSDMRRQMNELTATISRLSVVVQQTQQENKRLMESNIGKIMNMSVDSQPNMQMSGTNIPSRQSSRDSSVGEGYPRIYDRPRIEKWGLEFDGDQNKLAVEDFVFRIEKLQCQYGVTWKEVLDNFHLLVKGAAERWYWLFIKTNYVSEWSTLKSALVKQYQATRSSFELMRDIVERKQQPGESIDTFFFAMTQMRSRLSLSMPEEEMIKMIKKNLRESIGRIVYPISVSSVEELRTCCLDAEKTFLRKEIRPQPALATRFHKHVSEVYEEPMSPIPISEVQPAEVAGIRMNNSTGPAVREALVCWNCRQNGHVYMDCPSTDRNIFCYKCGKPEVITPNCSTCRNRNFAKNEGIAGNHRLSGDPRGDS